MLLDQDPTDIAATVAMFNILKDSNSIRVDMLASLLKRMGYNCDRGQKPQLTPAYLLTKTKVILTQAQLPTYLTVMGQKPQLTPANLLIK